LGESYNKEEKMKKLVALIFLIGFTGIYAQVNTAAIKLGIFSPASTGGGFIIGYEGAHYVDKNFSFGWSIDWFHKNYVDKTLINNLNEQGPPVGGGEINELRAKTNLHDLPMMIHISGKTLVAPYTQAYLTAGIGAEVLLINYSNYIDPTKDEFQAAFDLNWRVGIGGIYELSKSADVFAELAYHSSSPSWTYETQDANGVKKTFERVFDMSGVMFRVGFRFYY
jgi:hypothetical protein